MGARPSPRSATATAVAAAVAFAIAASTQSAAVTSAPPAAAARLGPATRTRAANLRCFPDLLPACDLAGHANLPAIGHALYAPPGGGRSDATRAYDRVVDAFNETQTDPGCCVTQRRLNLIHQAVAGLEPYLSGLPADAFLASLPPPSLPTAEVAAAHRRRGVLRAAAAPAAAAAAPAAAAATNGGGRATAEPPTARVVLPLGAVPTPPPAMCCDAREWAPTVPRACCIMGCYTAAELFAYTGFQLGDCCAPALSRVLYKPVCPPGTHHQEQSQFHT